MIRALREPSFHGTAAPVEHHETHISHVFVAGERAYKLKKAIVLPFVDYGTLERRHFFCREEIRLNRPLAPAIYLGVRSIVPASSGLALGREDDPEALEYVVEMRRFRDGDTLAAHVAAARCEPDLARRVGAHLAAFHAGAPVAEPAGGGAFAARVREDMSQLEEAAAAHGDAPLRIAARSANAFARRSVPEFDDRSRRGLVREAHGDLRLEHILVADAIQLVDCVEFDAGLRTGDVAYDLAFAVMELHDAGVPELAAALVAGYRSAGGDAGGDALLAGMAACRALVRAKVAAVRVPSRAGELDRFIALSRRLLWRARCPLTVVVCGPAATGKTTLAAELARWSGLPHLSSDVIRKARAGAAATTRLGEHEYAPAASRAVYEELGRRARHEAAAGRGAIVDATFRRTADRDAFDRAFADAPGGLTVLRLALPAAIARGRAAQRAADPARVSDADPKRAVAQALEFEPFGARWRAGSTELDANRPLAGLLELAEAAVDDRDARPRRFTIG